MGPWELISKLMSLYLPDNHLPDSDTRIVTQVVGGEKGGMQKAPNSWEDFWGLKILMWSVLSCAQGGSGCRWLGAGGDQDLMPEAPW